MTLAVFRCYVAPEQRAEHDRLYNQMHILIQQSPNHIEHKMFTAEDGESALVVEFDDLQSLEEWGRKPRPQDRQGVGQAVRVHELRRRSPRSRRTPCQERCSSGTPTQHRSLVSDADRSRRPQ